MDIVANGIVSLEVNLSRNGARAAAVGAGIAGMQYLAKQQGWNPLESFDPRAQLALQGAAGLLAYEGVRKLVVKTDHEAKILEGQIQRQFTNCPELVTSGYAAGEGSAFAGFIAKTTGEVIENQAKVVALEKKKKTA